MARNTALSEDQNGARDFRVNIRVNGERTSTMHSVRLDVDRTVESKRRLKCVSIFSLFVLPLSPAANQRRYVSPQVWALLRRISAEGPCIGRATNRTRLCKLGERPSSTGETTTQGRRQ